MSSTDEQRSHYCFHVSLRVRHPSIAREKITEAFGIEPKHSWKAGEPRHTPKGTPLTGSNRDTFWTAEIAAGRWPSSLNEVIHDSLRRLVRHRPFLHNIRSGGRHGRAVYWLVFREPKWRHADAPSVSRWLAIYRLTCLSTCTRPISLNTNTRLAARPCRNRPRWDGPHAGNLCIVGIERASLD
jgi:hypothetical protein